MISRFKLINRGYLRLLICLCPVAMIWGASTAADGAIDEATAGCIGAIVAGLAYWLALRIILWIYDGFKSERAK